MTMINYPDMAIKGALGLTVLASCLKDACERLMSTILKELQEKNPASPERPSPREGLPRLPATQDSGLRAGLVITGKALEFALQESLQRQFLELTACCQAVVCCRATPLQKSEVVKLVRSHLRVMTLAIGERGGGPATCCSLSCHTRGCFLSVPPSKSLFTLLSVLFHTHVPSPFSPFLLSSLYS